MNSAKRRKIEQPSLDDLLCVNFKKESSWIVLYFALVLACDTPILEALLYSTWAYTAVKSQSPNQRHAFIRALIRVLQDYVCSLKPALAISTTNLSSMLKFPNEKWIEFQNPLLTTSFPAHTLKVYCGDHGSNTLQNVLFISYISSCLYDVELQPIRYGSFCLVIAQMKDELKAFLEQ